MTFLHTLEVPASGRVRHRLVHGASEASPNQVRVLLHLPRGIKNEMWTKCAQCHKRADVPYVEALVGKRRETKSIRVHPQCASFIKDPRIQDAITRVWKAYMREQDHARKLVVSA